MAIKQAGRRHTETIGRGRGDFPNSMVQGWDAAAGLSQAVGRIKPRAAMGRKMTPIGKGKLSPK